MKKSIRGSIKATEQTDKEAIVSDINKCILWKLDTGDTTDDSGATSFTFEAWVDNPADETKLWTDMKRHADRLKGKIDRHDCTHDEHDKKPCAIAESYTAN
jgi:hypothetical protein